MAALTAHPSKLETLLTGELSSALGTGQELALLIGTKGTPFIAWQCSYSGGNPAAVTVLLEGSQDGTNWYTIDTSTNTGGEVRALNGAYRFVRANNSVATTGTGITLTVLFTYAVQVINRFVFGHPGINYYEKDVLIPTAQVLTLFSAPVQIVAPVAGRASVVDYVILNKAAGTAYTLGANTVFNLLAVPTSGAKITAVSDITLAGFLDQNGATFFIKQYQAQFRISTANNQIGNSWEIGLSNANMAVGSGNLLVQVGWHDYPTHF